MFESDEEEGCGGHDLELGRGGGKVLFVDGGGGNGVGGSGDVRVAGGGVAD